MAVLLCVHSLRSVVPVSSSGTLSGSRIGQWSNRDVLLLVVLATLRRGSTLCYEGVRNGVGKTKRCVCVRARVRAMYCKTKVFINRLHLT